MSGASYLIRAQFRHGALAADVVPHVDGGWLVDAARLSRAGWRWQWAERRASRTAAERVAIRWCARQERLRAIGRTR